VTVSCEKGKDRGSLSPLRNRSFIPKKKEKETGGKKGSPQKLPPQVWGNLLKYGRRVGGEISKKECPRSIWDQEKGGKKSTLRGPSGEEGE